MSACHWLSRNTMTLHLVCLYHVSITLSWKSAQVNMPFHNPRRNIHLMTSASQSVQLKVKKFSVQTTIIYDSMKLDRIINTSASPWQSEGRSPKEIPYSPFLVWHRTRERLWWLEGTPWRTSSEDGSARVRKVRGSSQENESLNFTNHLNWAMKKKQQRGGREAIGRPGRRILGGKADDQGF